MEHRPKEHGRSEDSSMGHMSTEHSCREDGLMGLGLRDYLHPLQRIIFFPFSLSLFHSSAHGSSSEESITSSTTGSANMIERSSNFASHSLRVYECIRKNVVLQINEPKVSM